ncbi:hypothetical protein CcaverHIS002_0208660 [Cutaneotrichosporon cavernicola]|uniref:Uncharacterized protein n=1 Tax=Cutaneotrichosporon cavernicola TaxID=279322 RepID=A0AA48I9E0_9TREE|nr:uncharacterized protein CcaverHIS019_0208670 [Cutaneotrichosporon cavernicola]BEI81706.1 hypothetical protein CcaverHIS002_0208660 [Cutaneotrichosporon cavernicola]BEI89505.1 hypothetical protein CcaverHIS019_0208670 [Cutaneotrichosporon cavernicola]BEI97278.1 hypothetical protein CcaverHIS631_0208670 [Cutaneotrichosporon cavernicola]BEJ05052.1 hypothetical protein CcaverHIS641_0208690 [Cutaneotrichosporon cavernicola]
MSNDLDDLVDYSHEDEVPDHEMESVSGQAEHETEPDLDEPPTDNELRLAARVLELESERDRLAVQLHDLESQYPAHSTTIPVPDSAEPIYVPPALIPVLSLLRDHIQELARDSAALRYTFLGPNRLSPGSSIATTPLSVDSPQTADPTTLPLALPVPSTGLGPPRSVSVAPTEPASVDLAAVVERVRTLILENDELGDMVAEAGRVDGEEWLRTLDESKAMIASLDADLTNNLVVVGSLRAELDSYKERFGPLDGPGRSTPAERGERAPRGGRNARRNGRQDDLYRPASGDGQRERERDRSERGERGERNYDRGERERPRGGGGGGGGGGQGRRWEGKDKDKDKDKDGKDGKPYGMSILGRANAEGYRRGSDGSGEARRDDDGSSKRRR